MPQGKKLRIALLSPALVHWSSDGWHTSSDLRSRDTGIGAHVVDLPTEKIASGGDVLFTIYWEQGQRWEGVDFCVYVDKH